VSTRDFSWGKGGRCFWLTTYHPCSAETSRKSGVLIYPEPLGPPPPVAGEILICTIRGTVFRKVRKETILKIHNTLIVPTFLYGSENWTPTASQRGRIEAAEMKLLRPLAGYTLHDHKTNGFIRRELKITGLLDKIDEYRLNWHLHLQRMSQNRIPLKSYRYRPKGRRTIGRPKKRWREQL